MARNRVCPAVCAELADPRPEEERSCERGERALVVDDRRAGEVLHAETEEPAAALPDPVRDDGVDEGEDDAEGEVDPELRALCHGAPDDRERDAREDDFEEIAGARRDRGEEAERRRRDPQELVDTREEPGRADDRVPVAEGEAEADRPVEKRADPEDEDVLGRDVPGVLHPGQAGLDEGEARLHEHDEHRRNDDPDGVHRDEEIGALHWSSTPSRLAPVLLCTTVSSGEVQTRPSPAGFPLLAASAIASTTASARPSSTTKTRSAFGRKRDSKRRCGSLLSRLLLAVALAGPALAQVGSKPAPTRVPAQGPALRMSQSPDPTFDEGTFQRINAAMLSYSALEVRGGWPTLPPSSQARARARPARTWRCCASASPSPTTCRPKGRRRRLRRCAAAGGEALPGPPRPAGDRHRRAEDARRAQRAGGQAPAPARGLARPAGRAWTSRSASATWW